MMKKILSLALVAALIAALSVPFFAQAENTLFETKMELVANDPTVVYDEWDIPYNIWNVIPANTAIHAGDTVTFTINYTIPADVSGYSERALGSIEFLNTFNGVNNLEVLEATGCPSNMNCDYDIGICMPGEGYSNVIVNGNQCIVMGSLGSTVQVVFRGTAASEDITVDTQISIGQYHFPAYFTINDCVCDLTKTEVNGYPCYNAHYSDFINVKKKDIQFRADASGTYSIYLAINGHYYLVERDGSNVAGFVPVDDSFAPAGDPIPESHEHYTWLVSIFDEYMDFFGLDPALTSVDDSSFIGNGSHDTFEYSFEFGANAVVDDPTEAPDDPTEAPNVPTEAPDDPTDSPVDPDVPGTGAISLLGIGIVSILGGAVIVVNRKRG